MLHEFVTANRDEIIRRCRSKVAARAVPPPTQLEIDHGVPLFLDQLVDALRLGLSSSLEIERSGAAHGQDVLRRGFTLSQLVHDYGDVCQCISELAIELVVPISTHEFQMLNGCLDDAIAGAVTQYGRARQQHVVEGAANRENLRLGFFAHELRNLIQTATIAFEVVKGGSVGALGSTGTVLQRSLTGARDLIDRSLAEVKLAQGVQHAEQFLVSGFLEELAPASEMVAAARAITFTVMPVEDGLTIEADRQILAAVIMNLLQNAFKFTKRGGTVTLRIESHADRVRFEVLDECGGLPAGDVDDLFTPFLQRGGDRLGFGLGLAFCRWAVEANGGMISVRDVPGAGCIFTVDLPRVDVKAADGARLPGMASVSTLS